MLDYNDLQKLITLANKLDKIGLYKEADTIESFVRESSFKNWVAGVGLGLGLMAPVSYTSHQNPEVNQTQEANLQKTPQSIAEIIAELNDSDFNIETVESGETAEKIAKKYYPDIDSVTGLKILEEANKSKDLNKLSVDDEIRVPKIESLQTAGAEAFIGKGLVKAKRYEVSRKLIDFVKGHEGFKGSVYDTKVGKIPDNTIGYGHKITDKESRDGTYRGRTISKSEAEKILLQDLKRAAERVNGCNLPLTEEEFIALTSLAFNYRDTVPESIRKLILTGNKEAVADKILEFSHAQGQEVSGLRTRRQAEAEMFRSGL